MELSFRTRELRSVCENEDKTASAFGSEVGDRLRRRLADLRAARTVHDLVAGRPRLSGDRNAELRLLIAKGYKLYCRPNHNTLPEDDAGMIDWREVYRLQVMDIEEPA